MSKPEIVATWVFFVVINVMLLGTAIFFVHSTIVSAEENKVLVGALAIFTIVFDFIANIFAYQELIKKKLEDRPSRRP